MLLLFFLLACLAVAGARGALTDSQRDMVALVQAEILHGEHASMATLEEHFVQTEDGYILGMFRLRPVAPLGNGQTVLLMHGLLDSSIVWVNNGKSKSLAFILCELGYDVWLGNNRGNFWSKRHIKLNPQRDAKFWDFSFDEMAQYDLPAMIDYALKRSDNPTLTYVGHSQGSTQLFAALSTERGRAKLLGKIQHFIGLAPAIFEYHMESKLMKAMAELGADKLTELIGMNEFAPSTKIMSMLMPAACRAGSKLVCENMLDSVYGKSDHLNVEREEVFLAQFPSGTSSRNVQHWAQHTRKPVFSKFDYGRRENLKRYGQPEAPHYDLSTFPGKLKTTLYFGENDALQAEPDRKLLQQALRNISNAQIEWVIVPGYSHVDFVWGKDSDETVFPHIVSKVKQHEHRPILSRLRASLF